MDLATESGLIEASKAPLFLARAALSPRVAMSDDTQLIRTVEWSMMDKQKFVPLSMASSFTVRCCLYPLTLVRTRLQIQHHKDTYRGTFDALIKIGRSEGVRGLYRGFWVSAVQVFSGLTYVSTYEGVRHVLQRANVVDNSAIRAFVGGGCASVVAQTLVVPFDVISQHLMILGKKSSNHNPLGLTDLERKSRARLALDVARAVLAKDGFKGFYRGYVASLCTYVPSSASWWTFYHLFQDLYEKALPSDVLPHLVLQCAAAMSSGCAACIITNPLDLVRARVQVQRRPFFITVKRLWREEGWRIMHKGLTARLTASVIYSLAIIVGYETVKRCSVYDEYKAKVKW